jgi:hypothetical protein
MMSRGGKVAGTPISGAQWKSAGSQLFQKGERVEVVRGSSDYELKFLGKVGVVERYLGFVWVRVDFGVDGIAKIETRLLRKIK